MVGEVYESDIQAEGDTDDGHDEQRAGRRDENSATASATAASFGSPLHTTSALAEKL